MRTGENNEEEKEDVAREKNMGLEGVARGFIES